MEYKSKQSYQQRLFKSEALFFDALRNHHPESEISNSHFDVLASKMDQFLEVEKIIAWLDSERHILLKKRIACQELLKGFPSKNLRIAFQPKEISFDFVIQQDPQTILLGIS